MKTKPAPLSFQVAILVGRWQLPHVGHLSLFRKALEIAPRILVVIGSSFRSRDTRQPFNAAERQEMILRTLPAADRERVTFLPVRDYFDDDRWNEAVGLAVAAHTTRGDHIALVGFKKDETTYYLDHFPQWTSVKVAPETDINASALRHAYFGADGLDAGLAVIKPYVTPEVASYLQAWANLPAYAALVREEAKVRAYRKEWTEYWKQTADAVVRINDHVLLLQRKNDVGHGQWAIPGGFVDFGERFLTAALRELKEETGLSMLGTTMRAAVKSSARFDHPLRSTRGRVVTEAYYFAFGAGELPEVRPSAEAMAVKWVPISELPKYEELLFEDHAAILDHFVGLFPAIA